jgi:hypothetical protein
MTVPMTDVNHVHQALVDDAAIPTVPDPNHWLEDQAKTII